MSDLIGKSLGRYQILEQIGEGGMATVYKAHDTRLDAEVAVKVIRTENLAPSILERALKRFEREAKALARLTHPNIVKVIDYGEYEDKPYLVLEYLPGGSLKKRLGKPIPWQEAFQLILPIARALDYAHRQNMIHRDVKPSNILMTEDGEPMLTDFGIAKVLDLDETADLTGTGMGIGTPEYMAPEQWQGNTSTQSDLYSLGVVLYEMITGRKPYTANTPAALLLKQATESLPRPITFVSDLPIFVERMLSKSLAKNPSERFENAEQLAIALEKLNIPHDNSVVSIHRKNTTGNDLIVGGEQKGEKRGGTRFAGINFTITGLVVLFISIVIFIVLGQNKSSLFGLLETPTSTLTPTSISTLTTTPTITATFIVETPSPLGFGIIPTGLPDIRKPEPMEIQAFLLTGQASYLHELAKESYGSDDFLNLPTFQYTIEFSSSKFVIWGVGWCASTGQLAESNFRSIDYTHIINKQSIPIDKFQARLSGGCVGYYTILDDWPSGENHLTIIMEIENPINDGTYSFPAGFTQTFNYTVYVP